MSNIQTKISQAKSKLLLSHPFFGAVAAKLEVVQNDDIQSFKSNGIKLEYNSDFLQKLEPAQMEFVFANGVMDASLAPGVGTAEAVGYGSWQRTMLLMTCWFKTV